MKVMVVFGFYFGFRGSKEHVHIERRNTEKGFFSVGHLMAGKDYWDIQNMANKTCLKPTRQAHPDVPIAKDSK